MKMKVLKFGGTSVGTPESIENVKNITLGQEGKKLLVFYHLYQAGLKNN